jgi:putative flippase GtrA
MNPSDSPPGPPESLTARILAMLRARGIGVKAVSFALVGAVNFWVDFGVFSFAHLYFGWPIIAANVAAWVVAVTGSYVMNSLITFAAESGRQLRLKDYATFALSQTGGLVANTATVFALSYFLPVLLAKALAIGVSFLVNFSLSHFVVFRRRGTTT